MSSMRESEPAVEAVAVSVSAEGAVRPYSSRHRRSQRDSDYYLQREPIPGCPSFYDMGQPQVFKSEIIDNYKGTKNLTSTSVAETNGTVPWLVFTVKSTRPAANAVRAVFLKLGMDSTAAAAGSKTGVATSATVAASATKAPAAAAATTANTNGGSASPSRAPVANGSGASSSTAASRRQRRAPAESACHLAALKVESDNCVSLHTMAVPFSEVEACGGFKVDNGKLVPGYTLYQTQGYLTWSDVILSSPGNTTSTTYLSTFPITFRRGIPGLFTPDTPVEEPAALLPPPAAGPNVGMIAGIVVGVVALLASVIGAFFYVRNRKREQKKTAAFTRAFETFVSTASGPKDDGETGAAIAEAVKAAGNEPADTFESEKTVDFTKSVVGNKKFEDSAVFKDVEVIALNEKTNKIQRVNSTVSVRNARVAGIVVESAPGQFAVITTKSTHKRSASKIDTDAPINETEDESQTPKSTDTLLDETLPPVIPPTAQEIKYQLGLVDDMNMHKEASARPSTDATRINDAAAANTLAAPAPAVNRSSLYESVIGQSTYNYTVPQSTLPAPAESSQQRLELPEASSSQQAGARDSTFWGPQVARFVRGSRVMSYAGHLGTNQPGDVPFPLPDGAYAYNPEDMEEGAEAYDWSGEEQEYLAKVAAAADAHKLPLA